MNISTPQPEAFLTPKAQGVSPHKLNQPAWAVHLGQRYQQP
ncbi:hypothetical protein ADICYQ_3353 [Cyclobacterium qasimii M12-11B]|uniref:Uncharacterized protein n=1 Tax=Cyclobacterium qasimii M12-11B TaxID=641524 RepID=S7WLL4_9BACT|nr:hypothetical protein ADICYQ_3353 [Cyclobacterium qasimii M12-11B]